MVALPEPAENLTKIKLIRDVRVVKAIDASGGAYSANDVINDTDCCGTCSSAYAECWVFPNMTSEFGGAGYISKAKIENETPNVTPLITLLLFTRPPVPGGTVRLADHSLNNSPGPLNVAYYVGKIDWESLESIGTEAYSHALATPSSPGKTPLSFICEPNSKTLYGILVTRTAYTQVAGSDIIITLTPEALPLVGS